MLLGSRNEPCDAASTIAIIAIKNTSAAAMRSQYQSRSRCVMSRPWPRR